MLRPVYINTDGTAFGTPWETFRYNDYWALQKSGAFIGYSAHISVIPELQVGLAVFVNSNGDDSEWPATAYPILIPALTSILASMQPPPSPVLNPELYIGTFVDPNRPTTPLTIARGGSSGSLIATFAGNGLVLQRQELVDPSFNATVLQAVVPPFEMSCVMAEMSAADGQYVRFDLGPDPTRALAARSVSVDGLMWGSVFYRKTTDRDDLNH